MADDDDLLNPDEIEALLNEAGAADPPPGPPAGSPTSKESEPAAPEAQAPPPQDDQISQEELDRLLAEATQGTAPTTPSPTTPPPQASTETASPENGPVDPSEIEKLLQENAGNAAPAGAAQPNDAASMSPGTEELLRQAEEGLAAAISGGESRLSSTPSAFGDPKPYAFQELGKTANSATDIALQALHDVELDIRIELGRTELLIDEVLKLRDGSVVPLDKLAGDPVDVIVNERLIARGEVLVLNDNFCVRITEILPPH